MDWSLTFVCPTFSIWGKSGGVWFPDQPCSIYRYRISIVNISTLLKNIDIDIDIDKEILENINIDKEILENIDIDIDKEILEIIDIYKEILENIDIESIRIWHMEQGQPQAPLLTHTHFYLTLI